MTLLSSRSLAVTPGVPRSVHTTSVEVPEVGPGDVLIRSRLVGICGTDREVAEAKFGSPPPGSTELVLGHELLGEVEAVGPEVIGLRPGDLVTATVRRGCGCRPCAAGEADFCETLRYTERGIIGRHGYLTERLVESAEHVVPVPASLGELGVLIEPLTCAEKAWRVATAVQSRMASWSARTAVVFGAGPIGLLQTLMLRARDIEVVAVARSERPNRQAELVERMGATYVSLRETSPEELAARYPQVDLIVECSGSSAAVQQAMGLLGNSGVLVLLSITGGSRLAEVDMDRLNMAFVLGNKAMVGVVNADAVDFTAAVADLQHAERRWPGLAASLITRRYDGLDAAVDFLDESKGQIKAVVEVG